MLKVIIRLMLVCTKVEMTCANCYKCDHAPSSYLRASALTV